MTYQETLDWMFVRLPMYQTQGASAFRNDLHNIRLLCDYLGNPEKKLRCIHVAGTNGKGSTCHMLASVLQESGYKTGLFTSPHLKDYRERIRINGAPIPEQFVIDFIARHRSFFEETDMSFFEMSTGLMFTYFLESGTDIAIVETGLGGRLDATNVVNPELSVITNIGFDHMQYLGDTLEKIAGEKAGIIKAEVPVVIGETTPETKKVFADTAKLKNAPILFAEDFHTEDVPSDLIGDYQKANKRTVLVAMDVLRQKGFTIPENAVRSGLLHVTKNTGLQGRWQILGNAPLIIADTAHNSHGLQPVLKQLSELPYEKLHIVLGAVNDKDLGSILPLFPKHATYYFAKPDIPRGLDAEILLETARGFGLSGKKYASVVQAFQTARDAATPEDVIYAGGSTFVVAEIL